jgi:hypothetical protein
MEGVEMTDTSFAEAVKQAEVAIEEALRIGRSVQSATTGVLKTEDIRTAQRFERVIWNNHTFAAALMYKMESQGKKRPRDEYEDADEE